MDKTKALCDKYTDLLSGVLARFIEASKKVFRHSGYHPQVKAGDGELPLAELAVRVFGVHDAKNDRWNEYFHWLIEAHLELGDMTPLELLSSDSESWQVRSALLTMWLQKNRLVVPKPDPLVRFVSVEREGSLVSDPVEPDRKQPES